MLKFTRARSVNRRPRLYRSIPCMRILTDGGGCKVQFVIGRPRLYGRMKFCSKREYAWRFRDEYSFPTGHEIYCVLHLYSTQLSYVTVATRDQRIVNVHITLCRTTLIRERLILSVLNKLMKTARDFLMTDVRNRIPLSYNSSAMLIY